MARQAQPRKSAADKMIDAALALAAEKPWPRIGMPEIADQAKVSLADAYDAFPCRAAIVAAVIGRHDRAMLAGQDPSLADESRRDRLFDVIMRRLEAMRPHKPALRSMSMGAQGDPAVLLAAGPKLAGSLKWMLRAAGVPAEGPAGFVRMQALAFVYCSAVRAFMRDDSEDLASTMATLDKALKRASRVLGG